MKQLWRHFETKSFEKNSENTNNSIPKTITLNEYKSDPVKVLDDAAIFGRINIVDENQKVVMAIDRKPPRCSCESDLPLSEPVAKTTEPTEQKTKGEKDVPVIRRKNQSKNSSNQKSTKIPRQKQKQMEAKTRRSK